MQHSPVNPSQPQQVKQDGQQHDEEAGKEQVVIVNKREAAPVGVIDPEVLLLDVPVKGGKGRKRSKTLNPQRTEVFTTYSSHITTSHFSESVLSRYSSPYVLCQERAGEGPS